MDTCRNYLVFTFIVLLTRCTSIDGLTNFDYCTKSDINHGKDMCRKAYGDLGQGNDMAFCSNVECFLQCMSDAIGDCAKRDAFFNEDINIMKVTYRAICSNPTFYRKAESSCQVQTPCVGNSFSADLLAKNNITNTSQADPMVIKRLECLLHEAKMVCIDVPISNQCTAEMDQLVTAINVVKHSVKECGVRQIHYMFDLYKAPINCKKPKISTSCFTPALMYRMSKCTPVSLFHIMESPTKGKSSICENVECIVQCYEQAIGDCYKKNHFLMLDPETIKVSARATCKHYNAVSYSMKQCRMSNMKCFQDLEAQLTRAYETLILNKKYAAYKTTACRASAIFTSCLDYPESDKCPYQDSSMLKSVIKSWHTYSQCEPRTDAIYKKFKGPAKCGDKNSQPRLSAYMHVMYTCLCLLCLLSMKY
ncbi:hypothetical protein ACF0H5_000922 [Mactra antiquata]